MRKGRIKNIFTLLSMFSSKSSVSLGGACTGSVASTRSLQIVTNASVHFALCLLGIDTALLKLAEASLEQ